MRSSPVSSPLPLRVILEMPYNGEGPSYTCAEIIRGMSSPSLDITLITPRLTKPIAGVEIRTIETLPWWARWPFPYRLVRNKSRPRMEALVSGILATGAWSAGAAHIWGTMSVDLAHTLRRHGIATFREATNCHQATAKKILDDAYRKAGLRPSHTICDETIAWENEFLKEMDFIFCPNARVYDSMLENGVPEGKLLSTSYGWSPSRIAPSLPKVSKNDFTVVFVGSISIRKGAHLLIEYWVRSEVKGRLLLVGKLEPSVANVCQHYLGRSDIILPGFIDDVASVYRSADIFVFPTLEEGGPQVTYEAAGCGLPIVTTPMGAGRIIEHNVNGLVLDPYDEGAWIAAFRSLSASAELRQRFGAAARRSASRFTWSEVGKERRGYILSRVNAGSR